MTTNELPARVSKLPLMIVGAVVGLAILLTVALVATSEPQTYEAGTPEAALQDFLNVGLDGDGETMFGMLTAESRASCTTARDRYLFDDLFSSGEVTAQLEELTVTGAVAMATVRLHQRSGNDPFDNTSWSYDERFRLERIGEAWLVSQASWPWPFDDCTRDR